MRHNGRDMDYPDAEHDADRRCCVPGCGVRLHNDSPVEVCRTCGMRIARVFSDAVHSEDAARDRRVWAREDERRQEIRDGVVYYLWMGDCIKIGFTTNLRKRIMDLRVDPDALLAYEHGPATLERERHREFQLERMGRRENFRPSDRLWAPHRSPGRREPAPTVVAAPSHDACHGHRSLTSRPP